MILTALIEQSLVRNIVGSLLSSKLLTIPIISNDANIAFTEIQ